MFAPEGLFLPLKDLSPSESGGCVTLWGADCAGLAYCIAFSCIDFGGGAMCLMGAESGARRRTGTARGCRICHFKYKVPRF